MTPTLEELRARHPSRAASALDPRPQIVGVAALAAERGVEEVAEPHAGDLDRVLQREEQPARGALVRGEPEQLLAVDRDRAAR